MLKKINSLPAFFIQIRLASISLLGGILGVGLAIVPAEAVVISGLDFIGEGTLSGGTTFNGRAVSELSGITYSGSGNTYYGIADHNTDARFYTLGVNIDSNTGTVAPSVLGETLLNLSERSDTEGIAFAGNDSVFISSEGIFNSINPFIATLEIDPFIQRFDLAGNPNLNLDIPSKFTDSTMTSGLRSNLSFESLTLTPDGSRLFTGTEGSLKQDQGLLAANPALRILQYDRSGTTYLPGSEFLYQAESGRGLVDLLAIDENTLLAIERQFMSSEPFSIQVYEVSLAQATDISGIDGLNGDTSGITPVAKTLLLDFDDLLNDGTISTVGNIEGLTFGPQLQNGQRSLLFVSDNGDNVNVPTQFLAFGFDQDPTAIPFEISPILSLLGLGGSAIAYRLFKKSAL